MICIFGWSFESSGDSAPLYLKSIVPWRKVKSPCIAITLKSMLKWNDRIGWWKCSTILQWQILLKKILNEHQPNEDGNQTNFPNFLSKFLFCLLWKSSIKKRAKWLPIMLIKCFWGALNNYCIHQMLSNAVPTDRKIILTAAAVNST